jgi:hypothetical protein
MKITELGIKEQTNEGFGDWASDAIKKAGVVGWSSTERGANKQSVISKQQDEKLKRYGQKDFYNKLSSSLKSAVASGVVAPTAPPPLPESHYKLFNKLLESRMLTEAESVSKFIQDFVGGQTREFVRNPSYSENIKLLADQIEASYDFNTKQIDIPTVDKIWETLWAWSKLGKKESGYGQFIDMDHDGTPDAKERADDRKNLLKKINNTDFNDPNQLKLLKTDLEKILRTIALIP